MTGLLLVALTVMLLATLAVTAYQRRVIGGLVRERDVWWAETRRLRALGHHCDPSVADLCTQGLHLGRKRGS